MTMSNEHPTPMTLFTASDREGRWLNYSEAIIIARKYLRRNWPPNEFLDIPSNYREIRSDHQMQRNGDVDESVSIQ